VSATGGGWRLQGIDGRRTRRNPATRRGWNCEVMVEPMGDQTIRPFESIESALEFMVLLEEEIADASKELHETLDSTGNRRHAEALNLALYKMHQLSFHTQKSRRILNDLRLIRGVLVGEGLHETAKVVGSGS